jgi:hypothetical protein
MEYAMERLVQVDRQQLETLLPQRFGQYMGRVMDTVNAAPDGKLIEGSEVQVHELMRQFEQEVYQAALQARIDSTESSFSPAAGGVGPSVREQGADAKQPADLAGTGAVGPPKVRPQRQRKHGAGG